MSSALGEIQFQVIPRGFLFQWKWLKKFCTSLRISDAWQDVNDVLHQKVTFQSKNEHEKITWFRARELILITQKSAQRDHFHR